MGSRSKLAELRDFRGAVASVAWSRDGKFLATGSAEPSDKLRIWDSTSWKAVRQWDPSGQYLVDSLAWSPDGTQLAVGVGDLEVWEVASGRMVAKLLPVGGVHSVTWSPDGKLLAFTSSLDPDRGDEGVVVVWDPSKGDGPASEANTVVLAGHLGLVHSVTWSPDGRSLASGGEDTTVKVWDLSAKQNTVTLSGHTEAIRAVSWSPDGRLLASGSSDDTIRVWDTGSNQTKATLQHPNDVTSLAWSPDATRLASGCDDATIRIWSVQVP
jgi:WD40 repeat protein